MTYKYYKNKKTKEIVLEDDAKDFALTQLGLMQNGDLCIKTRDKKSGWYTLEQLDMINMLVDWYYDVDWIMEQAEEEEGNIFELINEECYYDK